MSAYIIGRLNSLVKLWKLMADPVCNAAKWQPQGHICHQLGLISISLNTSQIRVSKAKLVQCAQSTATARFWGDLEQLDMRTGV